MAPGTDSNGGGGDPVYEHQDQVVVVGGDVSLHIGSVQGTNGSHSFTVNSGTDRGEDKGADAEDDGSDAKASERDEVEIGIQFYAEVEKGWEEEKIFQRKKLQCHTERFVDLLQKVN